jgi:hypothetical protein
MAARGHRRYISNSLYGLAQGGDAFAIDGTGNFAVTFDKRSDDDAIGEFEVGGPFDAVAPLPTKIGIPGQAERT